MKSVIRRIVDFVFPPRCVACKTLIPADGGYLCDLCSESYYEARARSCPLCMNPYASCTCSNRYMDRNGIHTLLKLYTYRARETDLPENKMIYRLKSTDDVRVISFLASELAPIIKSHLVDTFEYVLVGVPRSKSAVRKYGADHIALLCKQLSKELGVPYCYAIKRIGKDSPQKTKSREARLQSATHSYEIAKKTSLKNKHVILVDDVVTTGASIVGGAKQLRCLGARKIMAVVVGCSFQYHDLIHSAHYYNERRHKYGI